MLAVPERSDAVTTWKRWLLGVGSRSRMLLYEELASLVGAGIGIREALAGLASRSHGRRRRALERVSDAVSHGLPVGDALLGMPEHFSPVEARLVAAGEKTGRLDRAFRDAAAEIARGRAARERFLRSVAYPLFLLHFALFVPPLITSMVSGRSTGAGYVAMGVFVLFWGAVAACVTLHLSRRHTAGWGRAIAQAPLLGAAVRSAALSRATRISAALHDAGETLETTFRHAAEVSGNGWVASDLREAAQRVERGMPVSAALSCVGALESDARSLIDSGERSGTLAESFRRIADLEDERFRRAAGRVAVAVGAVMFAVVVVWVIQMAFAGIVRPMMQVFDKF